MPQQNASGARLLFTTSTCGGENNRKVKHIRTKRCQQRKKRTRHKCLVSICRDVSKWVYVCLKYSFNNKIKTGRCHQYTRTSLNNHNICVCQCQNSTAYRAVDSFLSELDTSTKSSSRIYPSSSCGTTSLLHDSLDANDTAEDKQSDS